MAEENPSIQNQANIEEFKGVLEFAYICIKSLILVHGGSIVALLTLVGTVWDRKPEIVTKIFPIIGYFSFGLFLAICISLIAYIAQCEYQHENFSKADEYRKIAIICSIASIIAYAVGTISVLFVIL